MIETVKKFELFSKSIREYINKSPHSTKYFIKKLGLSKPTFYRRLKNKTFSVKDLVKLSELLFTNDNK